MKISQKIKPITEDNKEPTTETVEIKEEKQENVEPTNENITPSEEKKPEEEKNEEIKIEPETKEIPITEVEEQIETNENKKFLILYKLYV